MAGNDDHSEADPTTPKEPGTVSFVTTLSGFGNNTGIVVPPEIIASLGAGHRPPVAVDLNGHRYRSTVGVMSGQHLVPVSSAIRKSTGLQAGDAITVQLTVDTSDRDVVLPADFAAALDANAAAKAFYASLANSLQRYHVDNVNGAKNPDTRQRRIDTAVTGFAAGKKR